MESAEIKRIISDYMQSLGDRICPAAPGQSREFPLVVGDYRYYADFAYRIDGRMWLFIEDDEGQTSTGNATKYWHWIERNDLQDPVHLVHIIGPSYRSHKLLSHFLCGKATNQHPTFQYHQITTSDWDSPVWIDEFKTAINVIVKR